MDPHAKFPAPAPCRPILVPLAGYRVTARHRDQSHSLVTLAENLRQAANRAKAFCDAIDGTAVRDGIVSVRVEEWIGTLTVGEWQPVSLSHGGFSHRFMAHDPGNGYHRDPSVPRTGDKVPCVLLGEKTRKGGWRARLLKCGTEGPITNTADVPKSAKPGQMVALRVGSISQDGKRIQFHWHEGDKISGQ
jgi:hypothetical protein